MHIKWRYRCVSCALCTAFSIISLMVLHSSTYNQSHSILEYQERSLPTSEDRTTMIQRDVLRQNGRKSIKLDSKPNVSHIKNVVAYSLETQLEMEKRDMIICPRKVEPPEHNELNTRNISWQTPENSSVFLYSAFLDDRVKNRTFIRVLAMIQEDPNNKTQTYFCQMWFEEKPLILVVEALVVDMWLDHWDPPRNVSKPVLMSCEIDHKFINFSQRPFGVSINLHPCSKSTTFLPITSLTTKTPDVFTVCVKGLDFQSDISDRLIEWIEMNRILGADKFLIYVYSIHARVRRILEFYAAKNIIIIIPLTLPPSQFYDDTANYIRDAVKHRLWQKRRNEIIPYNDCYYRNLHDSQFVIPLDIDELLIPVRHNTWGDMFHELTNDYPDILSKVSSFSVKNAYFLDIFPKESREYFHIMKHLIRSRDFSPGEDSVKSFVSTSSALTVFNHCTLRTLSPAVRRNELLPSRLMQMNHYKNDCDVRLVTDCLEFRKHRKRDPLVLKYKEELIRRVRQARREIFDLR